jgi:hypothetical protein
VVEFLEVAAAMEFSPEAFTRDLKKRPGGGRVRAGSRREPVVYDAPTPVEQLEDTGRRP